MATIKKLLLPSFPFLACLSLLFCCKRLVGELYYSRKRRGDDNSHTYYKRIAKRPRMSEEKGYFCASEKCMLKTHVFCVCVLDRSRQASLWELKRAELLGGEEGKKYVEIHSETNAVFMYGFLLFAASVTTVTITSLVLCIAGHLTLGCYI